MHRKFVLKKEGKEKEKKKKKKGKKKDAASEKDEEGDNQLVIFLFGLKKVIKKIIK